MILFIEDHAAVAEHPRVRLAQVFPQHRVVWVWARSGAEGLACARAEVVATGVLVATGVWWPRGVWPLFVSL